jgi:hypothetical protein
VYCATNGVVDSVVNVASPMLIYSFTMNKSRSGSNAEKDDGRKTVHRTKKRKTSLEMDG